MRLKLKFLLPSLQILLAVVLYWQSDAWNQAQRRISDMPGPDPAFTLLVAINFPAALVRAFVLAPLPEVWNRAFFIGSIGLLWYWLVLEYQSWRKRREAFTFYMEPSAGVRRFIVDRYRNALWTLRVGQYPAVESVRPR